jgi:hypothetical protein
MNPTIQVALQIAALIASGVFITSVAWCLVVRSEKGQA